MLSRGIITTIVTKEQEESVLLQTQDPMTINEAAALHGEMVDVLNDCNGFILNLRART